MRVSEIVVEGNDAYSRWAKQKAAENKARMKKEQDEIKRQRKEFEKRLNGEASSKSKKPDSAEIWRKVEDAAGAAFPDSDPIDRLIPYMEKFGLIIDDLDAAVKKHGGAKSFNDYLAQMWDDYANDQMADADNGHIDYNSQFYSVDDEENIKKNPNPWK